MAKLTELGFRKGVFSEAIVSTYNSDGSANAAPMGIKLLDEQRLGMSIFNTAATCRNLKTKKCAVVNLTGNIGFFYKSTFKETNPDNKVPSEWFVNAEAVHAPKLQSADATIEVTVDSISDNIERTLFSCNALRINAPARFPQVFCRAMPLTLEAITHATRVKAFIRTPEKHREVNQLIKTIQNCARVVERVAPNTEYTLVMADLLGLINSWRIKL